MKRTQVEGWPDFIVTVAIITKKQTRTDLTRKIRKRVFCVHRFFSQWPSSLKRFEARATDTGSAISS